MGDEPGPVEGSQQPEPGPAPGYQQHPQPGPAPGYQQHPQPGPAPGYQQHPQPGPAPGQLQHFAPGPGPSPGPGPRPGPQPGPPPGVEPAPAQSFGTLDWTGGKGPTLADKGRGQGHVTGSLTNTGPKLTRVVGNWTSGAGRGTASIASTLDTNASTSFAFDVAIPASGAVNVHLQIHSSAGNGPFADMTLK